MHPTTVLHLFGDGSVHFLSPLILPYVYDSLVTPDGGETITGFRPD
jgi:hypothetical protein